MVGKISDMLVHLAQRVFVGEHKNIFSKQKANNTNQKNMNFDPFGCDSLSANLNERVPVQLYWSSICDVCTEVLNILCMYSFRRLTPRLGNLSEPRCGTFKLKFI